MQSITMLKKQNAERGVAGIEILIEIVIGLFVLGVLVFAITLMGSEIADTDALYNTISGGGFDNSTTTNSFNETTTGCYPSALYPTYKDCSMTVTEVYGINDTTTIMTSGNYTVSGCYIYFTGTTSDATRYNNTLINITVSGWSYSSASDAIGSINDTYQEISKVVEWFPIIIIFGAIVVLILLTVLIIRTIRTSGYGGSATGMVSSESA